MENQVKMHQIWHFLARFAQIEALFAHLQQKCKKMSFEIHVTTISTGSLSFGLKIIEFFGLLSFFGLEFFRKC